MKNNTELKPCPFCGGEAKVYEDYTSQYVVQCDCCGCTTLHKPSKKQVINIWNRRVNDAK